MTNYFLSRNIKERNLHFSLQIADYSKYVCKGYYTSPEFGKDDCKWNLLVHVQDDADHENCIDVQLKRHECVAEEQFLTVKTSIVNCFGIKVLTDERRFKFEDMNEAQVLAVTKEQLKGYFGLNKYKYLPKDTLTLECDLKVCESNTISPNKRKGNFSNNISHEDKDFSEYFAHSRLVKKEGDYFNEPIRYFSIQSYEGRIITNVYQSECLGGQWSLVVYSTPGYNLADYLDIRIKRRESHERQLIKVKLFITDHSHNILLSKEKYVYFTNSKEVQLLSLSDNHSSFGVIKKQLQQNDTLILHCEMDLYEQIDHIFSTKEDFDKSVKTCGYERMKFDPYLIITFVKLASIFLGSLFITYFLCAYIMSFIWSFTSNSKLIKDLFAISIFMIFIMTDPKKLRKMVYKRSVKHYNYAKKVAIEYYNKNGIRYFNYIAKELPFITKNYMVKLIGKVIAFFVEEILLVMGVKKDEEKDGKIHRAKIVCNDITGREHSM